MIRLGATWRIIAPALALLGFAETLIASDDSYHAEISFEIPAQRLARSLQTLAQQADLQILFIAAAVDDWRAPPLHDRVTVDAALNELLAGTGLEHVRNGDVVVVRSASVVTTDRPEEGVDGDPVLGEAVVTGTLLHGIASASPLLVIDRFDIELSGFTTTRQLLQALPQNFGGGDNEGTAVSPGGSALNVALGSSINLRGLGSDSTLVLLNGRRLAPSAFGQFVDVSLIPLSAIERIEILADGASATYGSDAVGGVVNFILREDIERAETRVQAGVVTRGHLDDLQLSQTLGTEGSVGHAFLGYEYAKRSNLDAADRDYSAAIGAPFDLLPAQETHSLFATGSAALGERTILRATALGSQREAKWRLFNSVNGEPTTFPATTRQWNLGLGLEGALTRSWHGQLDASYSANDTDRDIVTRSALTSAERNRLDILAFDGRVDGAIWRAPAGDMRLALGIHGRRERYVQGGNGSFRRERTVTAAFGELQVPLVDDLAVSLAARYEHSSDTGGVTTPKLGVLWWPDERLRVRATYGRSFRAPALGEFDESTVSTVLFDFPDPAAADGTTLTLLLSGNNAALGPEEATTWTAGFDWQAPVAGALDVGVTYFNTAFRHRIAAPLPGVEVLSIFNDAALYSTFIERDPDVNRVHELTALPTFFNAFGPFNAEDIEALVDRRLQNISATDVSGVDLIATYALPTQAGNWLLQLNLNYLFEYADALTPDAPRHDVLDTVYHPIDLRARGGLTWQANGWTASGFVNYVDDSANASATPHTRVGSWTTLDLQLRYETSAGAAWSDGISLALSVTNAVDSAPPAVNSAAASVPLGFDPTNANPLGRFVSLALTKSW